MLYVWIWGESERDIEVQGTSNEILGHSPLLLLLSDFPSIFGVYSSVVNAKEDVVGGL